jgi:DNA-binding CsgD family transcriptional regulator
VIDQLDRDGRRFLLANKNIRARGTHAISPRELQVVAHASLGYSNKRIAYELAIAPSTVSTHLSHAAAKLGLRSRTVMIQTYAALAAKLSTTNVAVSYVRWDGDEFAVISLPIAPDLPDTLSSAEREVVVLVFAAKSNAAIARARGVSVHTVANQLASAMKKLGVGSRADLIAHLTRS